MEQPVQKSALHMLIMVEHIALQDEIKAVRLASMEECKSIADLHRFHAYMEIGRQCGKHCGGQRFKNRSECPFVLYRQVFQMDLQ